MERYDKAIKKVTKKDILIPAGTVMKFVMRDGCSDYHNARLPSPDGVVLHLTFCGKHDILEIERTGVDEWFEDVRIEETE